LTRASFLLLSKGDDYENKAENNNDSKSEKVYHFHVVSGILEYVLMPPRESSDAAGEREP